MEDSSKLLYFLKILVKVFNKFTDVFTCKSRNFQTDYENELFFYNTIIKFVILLIKVLVLSKKRKQETNFLILSFISHQKQWI